MKEMLEQLAEGRIPYDRPQLNMDDACISVLMGKNEAHEGLLVIPVRDGRTVKGSAYSNHIRLTLENESFEGTEVVLKYTINSVGMEDGEELSGLIHLVTNGGEYDVSFFVKIIKIGTDSSMGSVKNLFHFTNLASKDYNEAFSVFSADSFNEIFSESEQSERTLYKALKENGLSLANMEEFLIGIHKKSRVYLRLEIDHLQLDSVGGTEQCKVVVKKDGWGYISGEIKADGMFIGLNKKTFDLNDFDGKTMQIPFLIENGRLHAGKNFGTIRVITKEQELIFPILVHQHRAQKEEKRNQLHRKVRVWQRDLLKTWVQYRSGKEGASSAFPAIEKLLDQLCSALPGFDIYSAMQIYMSIRNGNDKAAVKYLTPFGRNARKMKDPVYYGIYCFLDAALHKNTQEAMDDFQRIRDLYGRNPNQWILLWLLLISPEANALSVSWRLEQIAAHITGKTPSPLLLLENYLLLAAHPENFKRLERGTTRTFIWAEHQGILADEFVPMAAAGAVITRYYEDAMLRLLMLIYHRTQTDEILSAIISCLVRTGRRNQGYFYWYQKGVEKDLKITGLYEAYIYTVSEDIRKRLPLQLVLYFQYNNTLDYKRKAFLYSNLYQYRKSYGDIYAQYEPQIGKFVTEQLLEKHIDHNLAKLYNAFLSPEIISGELAKALMTILFLHKVTVKNKNIVRISAVHNYIDAWQSAPVQEGCAYVNIYTDDYRIVCEDDKGGLFLSEDEYEISSLLDLDKFLPICEENFPDNGMLIMHRYSRNLGMDTITADNVEDYIRMVRLPFVEPYYCERIRGDILAYYYDNFEEDQLTPSMMDVNAASLKQMDRVRLIEIYISRGMYSRAYQLVVEFGPEKINIKALVRLCVWLIRNEEPIADRNLLMLCRYVYFGGKFDENILKYLTDYYSGSMEELLALNHSADSFEINSYYLKERILAQRLFTGADSMTDFPLYEEYRKMGGKTLIETAYLTFHAWNYFMDRTEGALPLFEALEQKYLAGNLTNDVSRLALLKYYANMGTMSVYTADTAARLLNEMACSDYRFAFYQKFPQDMLEPYFISDKYFVEYNTVPGRKVYIHYRLSNMDKKAGSSMTAEMLPEIYEGIYNREFTLFYGDELSYFITEELEDGTKKMSDTVKVCKDDVFFSDGSNRYDMINDMLIAQDLHDELTLKELSDAYVDARLKVHDFFKIQESPVNTREN